MDSQSMKLIAVTFLSAVLCACAGPGHVAKPDQSSDVMGTEPGFHFRMVEEREETPPALACADQKQQAPVSLSCKDPDTAKAPAH